MNSVSIIVPTLNRPDHLSRCLQSLAAQTLLPDQVLVGIRDDDDASALVVEEFAGRLPVRRTVATGVGVVGSMGACLVEATGDFIGLVDDDVELPPGWIATMVTHLTNEGVLGAGGRDLLMDHPEMRRTEPLTSDVGRICWYGRVIGDHHRGGGSVRRVDILRGSNILFRGSFLREVGFEKDLRGKGAQVNWEIALALQAKKKGGRFIFDPSVQVIHHVAPRMDSDLIHRGQFVAEGTMDIAFNETLVACRHAAGLQRIVLILWQFGVGSSLCPGVVHFVRQTMCGELLRWKRTKATIQGRLKALWPASKI